MPNGTKFPIVKMSWATGETMGSFLENRHGDRIALQNLRESLANLSTFLHNHNIAHGDIQPGNVMVSDMGRRVQLIDYDGMFVDEISQLDAAEIGLPNFQHPERRTEAPWNVNLDNFSFIVLDIALAILQGNPMYWDQTQSGDDKILFSAQDYSVPDASSVFNELKRDCHYAPLISKLQNICRLPFNKVPRLDNFTTWQPDSSALRVQPDNVATVSYIANYPVVDALRVNDIAAQNGNKVEVIGCVVGVKMKNTGPNHPNHPNRPYCFVEFEPWRPGMDQSFRFIIWSEGLNKLARSGINNVDAYFRGKYVSIVGLIEKWETRIPARTIPARGRWPARTFPERIATAYSICADGATFNFIDQVQADFRLGRIRQNLTVQHVATAAAPSSGQTGNANILDIIRRI